MQALKAATAAAGRWTKRPLYTIDNPDIYSEGSRYDQFAVSVAVSPNGTYTIVGAKGEGDADGDSSGKAYIFSTSTGALLHTLDNPNAYGTPYADNFGNQVSITDSYAVVGTPNEDDADGRSSGKVYIFSISTGELLHTLDNPNPYGTSANDNFSFSMKASNSYVIVGAYGEDEVGYTASGKAYIFSISTGELLHTLDNPNAYNTPARDYFGYSVSISDSYAIVGAYSEDQAFYSNGGKAYIFSTSTGSLLYTLDDPNPYGTPAGDYFGRTVAISNSYAIVGTQYEDDAGGTSSGKAYIYSLSTGALLHTLDNPNPYSTSASDYFGYSVSISDSYAIVGATGEDEVGYTASGKAYIFSTSTGALLHTLDNPNAYGLSGGDNFGNILSITDSYAIVGAINETDATGTIASGKAYIFNTSTGALLHTLDNPTPFGSATDDVFGRSSVMSDSYLAIGSAEQNPNDPNVGGLVHIYDPSTGTLLHTVEAIHEQDIEIAWLGALAINDTYLAIGAPGSVDSYPSSGTVYIVNPATGSIVHTVSNPSLFDTTQYDQFGSGVAMNNSYLAVGAPNEFGADGSFVSGVAYVFDTATWTLQYSLLNPNNYDTSESDHFAFTIQMSDSYLAVSAPYEDNATNINTGATYVYDLASGSLLYTLTDPRGTVYDYNFFGASIVMNDVYLAISAPSLQYGGGAIHVFDTSSGNLLYTIDSPDISPSVVITFPLDLALQDNRLVVGSQQEDVNVTDISVVYVFDITTGELLYTIDKPTENALRFGASVSASSRFLCIGASGTPSLSGNNSGSAAVYSF